MTENRNISKQTERRACRRDEYINLPICESSDSDFEIDTEEQDETTDEKQDFRIDRGRRMSDSLSFRKNGRKIRINNRGKIKRLINIHHSIKFIMLTFLLYSPPA